MTCGLRAVFLAERAMLLRLLRARLGCAADAEDALQEMWFRIERAEARPVADAKAYLFRIASNLASDRRLAKSRRETLDTAWVETQPEAAEHPDAERAMLARERLADAQATIAVMPERMRTAYLMFRIEALSQREIAGRLCISLSAVEKLLQRAYARLHRLEDESDAED